MSQRANDAPPRFPVDHAFIVQFQGQPTDGRDRAARVEHLASGREARVRDAGQLMLFVEEVLAGLEAAAGQAPEG